MADIDMKTIQQKFGAHKKDKPAGEVLRVGYIGILEKAGRFVTIDPLGLIDAGSRVSKNENIHIYSTMFQRRHCLSIRIILVHS